MVGSSNYDATYQFNPAEHGGLGTYALYHTSYELFSVVKRFIDPEFYVSTIVLIRKCALSFAVLHQAHRTMGQFTGVLALILAESPVLPLNVSRYPTALSQIITDLKADGNANLNLSKNSVPFMCSSQQTRFDCSAARSGHQGLQCRHSRVRKPSQEHGRRKVKETCTNSR